MNLQIIYEDAQYLAVFKPSGVHSVLQQEGGLSIAQQLLMAFPQLEGVGAKSGDTGLVHRLDVETSGVLIAAKTQDAWQWLHDEMKHGRVSKRYYAVVEGNVRGPLSCAAWIGARYRRSKRVHATAAYDASYHSSQPAISYFRPCSTNAAQNYSIVEVEIPTGRRHQIRAHAAFCGHPLVGDKVYGSVSPSLTEETFLLHAYCYQFANRDSLLVTVQAPISGGFAKVFPMGAP
jgi:23S rRNA pseudouridine1911/1915/1917 synthase